MPDSHQPLTMESLRQTFNEIKAEYPDSKMLKEVRLLNHKYIKKLIPDPPKEDLPLVWGIPVVTDPDMPPNKIKLVFRDGREESFDV